MNFKAELTPLMTQYFDLRNRYKGAILFFRLGDFYEMFDDDARWVSKALGLTLTVRHGYAMCGVPVSASEGYLQMLLDHGKKVAICEQIGIPEKGCISDRDVVEVLTPASSFGDSIFKNSNNQYLAAIGLVQRQVSFTYIDISTGEFITFSHDEPLKNWLSNELDYLEPKEILIQESLLDPVLKNFLEKRNILITPYPDWFFNCEDAYKRVVEHFGVSNLKGFGFTDQDPSLVTAGALLSYLKENTRHDLPHIRFLRKKKRCEGLVIDEESRKNLEIFHPQNNDNGMALLQLLNETLTSSGMRLLKSWLGDPLTNHQTIGERLDNVDFFYKHEEVLKNTRQFLSNIQDIGRIAGRIAMDKAHAKNLIALRTSLENVLECYKACPSILNLTDEELENLSEIKSSIARTLSDDPNITPSVGEVIRHGHDTELDYFSCLAHTGLEALQEYTKEEREATGLNLRLKDNRVVGYFFEINKNQTELLPSRFTRRQSMMTGERFTTEKLVQLQMDIMCAKEKIIEIELRLLKDLLGCLKENIQILFTTADKIAVCDVLAAFAYIAHKYHYVRPILVDEKILVIKNGRHPIVERMVACGEFIPNDLSMSSANSCFLITGPNMAGKSTYLRQIALIVLMASIGCYVPADYMEFGCVDRIFCRVGASDNLARGESTFLVEMNETAKILHYATHKSLVIMDEVGRGTSSTDGLALAQAILKYLSYQLYPYTLFATHYHELTQLELPQVQNYSLGVLEKNGQIIFLKKVKKGPALESYGLHVARLAGIPEEVLKMASDYLQKAHTQEVKMKVQIQEKQNTDQNSIESISFPVFSNLKKDPDNDRALMLWKRFKGCDLNDLTPINALKLLHAWKLEHYDETIMHFDASSDSSTTII